MKIKTISMVLTSVTLLAIQLPATSQADIVNFDELSLASQSYMDGYSSDATGSPWTSNGVEFNTGAFTGGWSYSNVDDTTTAGFTNQWAAYTGTDFSGSGNYALANAFTPDTAFFNLASDQAIQSIRVTNTTYAALSMLNGDAFGKAFGGVSGDDPDYFKVIFNGYSGLSKGGTHVGSVEFYLADYRFADNGLDYIIDSWEEVDLSSISGSRSIAIEFEGSDVGDFGLNTPTYVAVDQLQLTSVPEPGSVAGLSLLGLCWLARRRRIR